MTSDIRKLEYKLVKTWIDKLMEEQIVSKNMRYDGGILCPSCLHIHGRIIDLVYPLSYLGDVTGEKKYADSAEKIFDWGENLYCNNKSYYNDAQQTWNNTTIFFAQSLVSALSKHGKIFSEKTKLKWENRLREISDWMYNDFAVNDPANTNYHAACAAVMAMVSQYFHVEKYMDKAKALKAFCESFISADNFFFGEGNPREYITSKGCKSIDIGYSIEESVPALIEYARLASDQSFMKRMVKVAYNYLDFLLPDGGLDNSFGTRNFKWTYWGSRTSDGFYNAFTYLSAQDPVFLEAVYLNLKQLDKCTVNGYLYGGPDYACHGEEPCIHHAFTHAKAITACLDMEDKDYVSTELHAKSKTAVFYPSLNTYKLNSNHIQTTITGFDYNYTNFEGGHISGGAMSLLWHDGYGAVIASGISDTTDREPLNIQLSLKTNEIATGAAKFLFMTDNRTYSNIYDTGASISTSDNQVTTDFVFSDISHQRKEGESGRIVYKVNNQSVEWHCSFDTSQEVKLILPIVARHNCECKIEGRCISIFRNDTVLKVFSDFQLLKIRNTFSMAPGFECKELTFTSCQVKNPIIKFEFKKNK